jgi:hypothetical protein
MSKTYWQVAAGSRGRNYDDLFLKFGMAFVGGDKQVETMKKVSAGDIILLKRGVSRVIAVGEVVEREGKCKGNAKKDNKQWLGDFDGWDLSAYCYVDWHVPENPIETSGLTRSTIQKIHQNEHKRIADSLLDLPVRPYEPEPSPTNRIRNKDILKFLISEGLRPSAADDLTSTFRRIRLLADYYFNLPDKEKDIQWEDIREHEVVTFLIIPLLLALGWAEQQIKIELPCSKGRIDIACFSRTYRKKNDECVLIIEAKEFASGLDYAPAQALRYAKDFPSCQVIVVSNGYCYKTYVRSEDTTFNPDPSAYLNLLSPQDEYPLDPDNVGGALTVLKCLLPMTLK